MAYEIQNNPAAKPPLPVLASRVRNNDADAAFLLQEAETLMLPTDQYGQWQRLRQNDGARAIQTAKILIERKTLLAKAENGGDTYFSLADRLTEILQRDGIYLPFSRQLQTMAPQIQTAPSPAAQSGAHLAAQAEVPQPEPPAASDAPKYSLWNSALKGEPFQKPPGQTQAAKPGDAHKSYFWARAFSDAATPVQKAHGAYRQQKAQVSTSPESTSETAPKQARFTPEGDELYLGDTWADAVPRQVTSYRPQTRVLYVDGKWVWPPKE